MAKPIKPAQNAEIANASVNTCSIADTPQPFEKSAKARPSRASFAESRPSPDGLPPHHMCCIIVSGLRSLTMSAIVSTTVVLPSLFHQC